MEKPEYVRTTVLLLLLLSLFWKKIEEIVSVVVVKYSRQTVKQKVPIWWRGKSL